MATCLPLRLIAGNTCCSATAPIQAAVVQIADSPKRKAGASENQNTKPPSEGSNNLNQNKSLNTLWRSRKMNPVKETTTGAIRSTRFLRRAGRWPSMPRIIGSCWPRASTPTPVRTDAATDLGATGAEWVALRLRLNLEPKEEDRSRAREIVTRQQGRRVRRQRRPFRTLRPREPAPITISSPQIPCLNSRRDTMMHRREVPIGNSGQMVSGHHHYGTERQYAIESQPLSRYPHLRFRRLRCGRLLYRKLVSREIGLSPLSNACQPRPKYIGCDSLVHVGFFCRSVGEDENETE